MTADGDLGGLQPALPRRPTALDGALRGWSLIGVFALALAGLFAVLLVLSRTPFLDEAIAWPDQFFQKGLVAHVVLAFVVWFLAVLACLSCQTTADYIHGSGFTAQRWRHQLPLWSTGIGMLLVLVAPFIGDGEPTLNNYIPVIVSPWFYSGLILIGLGVLGVALNLLTETARSKIGISGNSFLMVTGALLYIAALSAFAVAFVQLGAQALSFDYNERLMWGGGHLLQFVNLTLLVVAWDQLNTETSAGTFLNVRIARLASALLVLSVAVGMSFFGWFGVNDPRYVTAFTFLQFALAAPLLVILFDAVPRAWRSRACYQMTDPAFLSLASSFTVFMVGAALGLFVDGADTRTPAHYHGVIGGINLAFVGLFYCRFLPALGRNLPRARVIRIQIWVYAVGQLLFVVGMFAAGGMGATRKSTETAIDLDNAGAIAATAIRDLGGALSIAGGLAFIYIAARALISNPTKQTA